MDAGMSRRARAKRVFLQLVKEAAIPVGVGVAWAIYNYKTKLMTVAEAITLFFGAVVGITYLTSQVYRVGKQLRTDDALKAIDGRVTATLEKLEEKTATLLGSVTGGESFCHLSPLKTEDNGGWANMLLVHVGTYPLYDLSFRFFDLDRREELDSQFVRTIGPMFVQSALQLPKLFRLGDVNRRTLFLVFSARNWAFAQTIRFARRKDGTWAFATKIEREGKTLLEKIDDDFPGFTAAESWWGPEAWK